MPTVLPDHVLRLMSPADRQQLGSAGTTATEAQARYQRTAEKRIHETVCAWLRRRNIPFIHCRMDKPATIEKGWPDVTIIHKGCAYLLELKAPGGRLSADQEHVITRLRNNGTPVMVAYSDAEAIDWLRSQLADA